MLFLVSFQIDSYGVITECQCECGAGQGPDAHCKHVGLTLHGYSKLFTEKEVLTELTCTQVLLHTTKTWNIESVFLIGR